MEKTKLKASCKRIGYSIYRLNAKYVLQHKVIAAFILQITRN